MSPPPHLHSCNDVTARYGYGDRVVRRRVAGPTRTIRPIGSGDRTKQPADTDFVRTTVITAIHYPLHEQRDRNELACIGSVDLVRRETVYNSWQRSVLPKCFNLTVSALILSRISTSKILLYDASCMLPVSRFHEHSILVAPLRTEALTKRKILTVDSLVNLTIWLFDPNRDVTPREDIDAPCRRAGEQRALLLLSFLPF